MQAAVSGSGCRCRSTVFRRLGYVGALRIGGDPHGAQDSARVVFPGTHHTTHKSLIPTRPGDGILPTQRISRGRDRILATQRIDARPRLDLSYTKNSARLRSDFTYTKNLGRTIVKNQRYSQKFSALRALISLRISKEKS